MKLAILIAIFACLVACADKGSIKNDCVLDLEVTETEIYSIVANHWLENSHTINGKTVVIYNKTYSFKDDHVNISLENRIKHLTFDTNSMEDFQSKNQEFAVLGNKLKLPTNYQYLSPEVRFYKNNLTKDFVNTYPDVALLIGFSRIGFNKDYSKALLYSYNTLDRGSYFELERQNCEWEIKQESPLWYH